MHTQIGVTVGTPAYMSPEQAAGEPVDGRSDLFALGCVLFEMLTGEVAFTGPTVQATIARRFVHTPPPMSVLRPDVPLALADLVDRLIEKEAEARVSNGAQVVETLRTTVVVPAAQPAPATPAPRSEAQHPAPRTTSTAPPPARASAPRSAAQHPAHAPAARSTQAPPHTPPLRP